MNRKEIISGIISLLFFTGTTFANPSLLNQYLEQLYKSHVIPGFSVVVVEGDKVAFKKGYGLEYIDGNQPMTSFTSTGVGSLAKSFTSFAMMQLVEKGKISLDDRVVTHIPWFRTANKELSDQITIRMLLNNTSGLRAPMVRNRDISDNAVENLVKSLESVYLTTNPGIRYEYSNDGFALAGLLISEVSGMPYERYLEEFVFKPLEMKHTTNNPNEFDALNVLYGHHLGIDMGIPVHGEEAFLREYVAAGSLLRSSAGDLANYLITLLNDGKFKGKQIISPESVEKMWNPYSSFPGISEEEGGEGLPFHYGLGWFSGEIDGKKYIFHGGNRRTMSSMTFLFPEEKIGVSLLANIDLTFIDKYSYSNAITILNNIVRLLLDEPISNFAVPRVADPTLNNFMLPKTEKLKYIGEYILSEGKDWIYLGSNLSIIMGENGLEGKISKGEQIIESFEIDFITPKTAINRNLSLPHGMVFKFLSNGEISDVFISGKKYSKLTEGYYSQFQLATSKDDKMQFYYPADWNLIWEGENFKDFNKMQDGETILGQVHDTEKMLSQYFEELFPGHEVRYKGKNLAEISGSHFWEEKAFVSFDGEKQYQHFLCITKTTHKSYVIILTSQDCLTRTTMSVIPTLLSTFNWKD